MPPDCKAEDAFSKIGATAIHAVCTISLATVGVAEWSVLADRKYAADATAAVLYRKRALLLPFMAQFLGGVRAAPPNPIRAQCHATRASQFSFPVGRYHFCGNPGAAQWINFRLKAGRMASLQSG
jgi:hypothetical protein